MCAATRQSVWRRRVAFASGRRRHQPLEPRQPIRDFDVSCHTGERLRGQGPCAVVFGVAGEEGPQIIVDERFVALLRSGCTLTDYYLLKPAESSLAAKPVLALVSSMASRESEPRLAPDSSNWKCFPGSRFENGQDREDVVEVRPTRSPAAGLADSGVSSAPNFKAVRVGCPSSRCRRRC